MKGSWRAYGAALAGVLLVGCGGGQVQSPTPAAEPAAPPVVALPQPAAEPTGRVDILWDTWGIPHVYAKDETALFWAFGWAQAASHANLLLRLYGQARGRAAEYWGENWRDSDVWVHTTGIPGRAKEWLERQDPYSKAYLDAFAEGINAYAGANPDSIDATVAVVLPVSAEDVLAHWQRVINFTFVTSAAGIDGALATWQRAAPGDGEGDTEPGPVSGEPVQRPVPDRPAADGAMRLTLARPSLGPVGDALVERTGPEPVAGSNGWAVAPSRSSSGNALLLANPHLPWGDLFTWFEAHLVLPDMDAYGAALVGAPLLGIAFNENLGWTHTVNTIDAADLYELHLSGRGYMWNGRERPFDMQEIRLSVRQSDGTLRSESITVMRSVHGPVVARRGNRALALRVAGLDAAGSLHQTMGMLKAANMGQFEAALSNLQIPMFTVLYADRDGHILHVFNGRVPARADGDWRTWSGIVNGDTPETLWTEVHAYGDLPRAVDPGTGWLQNANDPPWTTTFPSPLQPDDYVPYMAPQTPLAFRPQRSARMLAEDSAITFAELIAYKHSTRVESADHILEDLVLAARTHGSDRARRAAQVLEAWDRSADADSRGAILWTEFLRRFLQRRWPDGSPYDVPWMSTAPFSTPDGLADAEAAAQVLDSAAEAIEGQYGALDIAWGEVHRLRRDGVDLPASGGPGGIGVFRVFGFADAGDGKRVVTSGDSFVAAVEFGPTVRAAALLAYGNSSQPGSPHRTDQLPLLARGELRPVWFTRSEIEAHLARHERY